jgi:hypothetical protein
MLGEATAVVEEDEDVEAEGGPMSFVKIRPYTEVPDWIEAQHGDETVQQVRLVLIEIPYRRAAFDDEKSILLVDGQQRTAALALVSVQDHPSIEMAATAVTVR